MIPAELIEEVEVQGRVNNMTHTDLEQKLEECCFAAQQELESFNQELQIKQLDAERRGQKL